MAKLIKKIRTEDGDLQIDYKSLANLPQSDTSLSTAGAFADAKTTGDKLKETNEKIDNLTNGTTTAPALNATDLKAKTFSLNGSSIKSYDLTMGSVASGKVLSPKGAINLAHSHAVIVNDDGTITLGEVSATGGNFKIADTKAYKDGVSAAKDSVTLSAGGWSGGKNIVTASNGKTVTVNLPSFSTSGGTSFDANNKTTVSFSTPSVSTPLKTVVVDASGVYNSGDAAGYERGYAEGSASNNGAVATTITLSRDGSDSYNASTHATDVHVKALADNGVSSTQTFTVSGESAYNAGYNAGYGSGPSSVTLSKSWSKGTLTVKASNGKTSTATLDKGTETWDGNTCSFPITDGGSSTGCTCSVDASARYTAGSNAVTLSKSWSGGILTVKASNGKTSTAQLSKGTETWDGNKCSFPIMDGGGSTGYTCTVDASSIYTGGKNSVTVPNANIVRQAADSYAGGDDHSTTVYIKATASNGAYGTQSFTVSGASAYSVGYNSGWNECIDNCSYQSDVYRISEYAPGTLYIQVSSGVYSSVGSSWVKTTRATGLYEIPGKKS